MAVVGVMEVKGLDTLLWRLETLPKKAALKVFRQSLRAGAKIIQTDAKQRAPVKSGALRKSVKVRARKRSRSGIGVRVSTSADDSAWGGDQFYGAFQEFGWKAGGRRISGREARRIASQEIVGRRIGLKGRNLKALLGEETATRVISRAEQVFAKDVERESKRRQIPGKHFLERAFEAKKEAAAEAIHKTMLAGIEREAASA